MKEIRITYFRADQLSLFIHLFDEVSNNMIERIYDGYSASVISDEEEHERVTVQVWNILKDDIEMFGSHLDKHVMNLCLSRDGYDPLKVIIEDDPGCIKCKIRGIINTVMNKALNTDEVMIRWYGEIDPASCCSSIPRLIYETLDEMDKDESEYEWTGMLQREGFMNIVRIKKREFES